MRQPAGFRRDINLYEMDSQKGTTINVQFMCNDTYRCNNITRENAGHKYTRTFISGFFQCFIPHELTLLISICCIEYLRITSN